MINLFDNYLNAIKNNEISIIANLINSGFNINSKDENENTLLHFVVQLNNLNIIKLILDSGVNPNIRDQLGWTPLHWAVSDNREEIVKLILDYNIDLNLQSKKNEWMLLHLAAFKGNPLIINDLLYAGADPNIIDANDELPEHIANSNHYYHVAELFQKWNVTQQLKILSKLIEIPENDYRNSFERQKFSGV